MALGNQESRTIVNLALVRIALGRSAAAQTLLAANADNVPAADYGLAMAMAGNAPEGVRILSEAIHDPSATARTRQNLRSEEHTSELQSLMRISYAVFCLKKKQQNEQ